MIFQETPLPGAFVIDLERKTDERGFFARAWCRREFEDHGLNAEFVQCNISYNSLRGTLRGLHYQAEPHAESKVVRVTRGRIFDVIVDIRESSATFGKWFAVELTAENRSMLYIPEGMAHGFQTLEDDTEVFYQMGAYYEPSSALGIRWNDLELAIEWPLLKPMMSSRDRAFPTLTELTNSRISL